jgi:PLP dependent protein
MTDTALRLQQIRDEVAAAARVAGRKSDDICLIAVSKNRCVSEIQELLSAGQTDFGESRVQEAQAKWPNLLARHAGLRLHCIGRLQSNKAAEAVRLFDVIHSVDRHSLLAALVGEAQKADRFPAVYLQVNIGEEEQKGGCALGEVAGLLSAIRSSPLPLAGLMAIPPLDVEPAPYFALLAQLARRHDVTGLSMGMSSDFSTAIKLGATAVRVGTALFEG